MNIYDSSSRQRFQYFVEDNLIKIQSVNYNSICPIWDFTMYKYTNFDLEFHQLLGKYLLEQKKIIIDKFPPFKDDGDTGLGPNSITSRYPYFNLFSFTDPLIIKLQNLIKKELKKYLELINFKVEKDLFINCWYNVLETEQKMRIHSHSTSADAFISGHYTVWCQSSSTFYDLPYKNGRLEFDNLVGEGIFFPSYLEHGTTPHYGSLPRITIAFDIVHGEELIGNALKNNVVKLVL